MEVKRFLKFIAILIGAAALLIVVAALVLPLIVNPNHFKPQIEHAVKEKTGRELTLHGDIHLSVFPSIRLRLGKTELSNARGFGKRPFARVKSVDISVALLPLLHKQIIIRKVELDGVELNLARDRHGRNNWDDMVRAAQRSSGTRKQVPASRTSPAAAAAALANFRIDDGIDIQNATFRWDDARARQSYLIDRLALRTGAIAPDKPIDLHLSFDLRSGKPVLRTPVDLRSRLTLNPQRQTLRAQDTRLEIGPLTAHADLRGEHLLERPVVRGTVSINEFSPARLMERLGVHYTPVDSDALGRASMKTDVRATPDAVFLDKLHLKLDDSSVTGSASAHFASLPAIDFNLKLNGIDLDRYLPKAKGGKKTGAGRAAAPLVVPIPLVKKLNLHGTAHIGKLTAFGIRSTDIAVRIAANNGFATLGPNTAKLYGGRYLGNTTVDVRHGAPRFTMDERLNGVQLGGLLKDTGIFDRFSGIGDVHAKLNARGMDSRDILHSLNGTAAVSLRNGSLHGVDVYNTVVQSCQTGRYVPGDANAVTPFASLHASANLRDGVADNRDLRLAGKLFQVTGSGKVNLGRGTLDYLAEVRLLEKTQCPLSIFHVPLKGKLSELNAGKIIHDAVAYEINAAAKREVQKKIDEEKAKIQRQIEQQMRKQFGQ
jgi:AsmA protein